MRLGGGLRGRVVVILNPWQFELRDLLRNDLAAVKEPKLIYHNQEALHLVCVCVYRCIYVSLSPNYDNWISAL